MDEGLFNAGGSPQRAFNIDATVWRCKQLRDLGALESALYRPQSGYYQDIIQEAAALMESLAINHPFVDANKRVAFAVTDIFLGINGYRISQPPMDIYG